MSKHQLRLLLFGGGALALMVVSLFAVEWFRITIDGMDAMGMGMARLKLGLRSVTACLPDGRCETGLVSALPGFYSTAAPIAFYASCGLVIVLAYQTGSRLLRGFATNSVTQLGYPLAIACFCAAGAAGYLFQPETATGNVAAIGTISVTVTRTWGPAMLLLGDLLALVALYLTVSDEPVEDAPLIKLAPVSGRIPTPTSKIARLEIPLEAGSTEPPVPSPPVIGQPAPPRRRRAPSSIPFDVPASSEDAAPAISRTTSSAETSPDALARAMSSIPLSGELELPLPPVQAASTAPFMVESDLPDAGVVPDVAKPSRRKLSFATATIVLSSDGVAATREDGARKVVAWSDVVGVVARRLPADPPHDGETFVDLVSTAGSTLRILPWTELTGEELHGDRNNPVERARAFVQLVASRCPTAKLDPATRTFLGSRGLAAQLPSLAVLAQHDVRLS